jgi:hypothetical protein
MAEHDNNGEHDELIRQIFYLLTAKFEDGAGLAADGPATGRNSDAQLELANRLRSFAQEALILADTVVALSGA